MSIAFVNTGVPFHDTWWELKGYKVKIRNQRLAVSIQDIFTTFPTQGKNMEVSLKVAKTRGKKSKSCSNQVVETKKEETVHGSVHALKKRLRSQGGRQRRKRKNDNSSDRNNKTDAIQGKVSMLEKVPDLEQQAGFW